MILDFADQTTEDIYNGIDSRAARRIRVNLWPIATRKLDMLNAAKELRDLQSPPGNRLEKLKRSLAGLYGIRVNDQFRIIFRRVDGNARNVRITDYR